MYCSGPPGAAAHGSAPLRFAGAADEQAASERGLTLTSTRLGVSSTQTHTKHREPRGPDRTTEPPGLSDRGKSDSPGSCPAGSKAVGWLSGTPGHQGWTPGSRPPSSLGHRAGLAPVPSAGQGQQSWEQQQDTLERFPPGAPAQTPASACHDVVRRASWGCGTRSPGRAPPAGRPREGQQRTRR